MLASAAGCAGRAPCPASSIDVIVDVDAVGVFPVVADAGACARDALADGVCMESSDAPPDCSSLPELRAIIGLSLDGRAMDMQQFRALGGAGFRSTSRPATLVIEACDQLARIDVGNTAPPRVNGVTRTETTLRVDADDATLFFFCAGSPRASECCASLSPSNTISPDPCIGHAAAAVFGPRVEQTAFGEVRVWDRTFATLEPTPQCI